MTNTQLNSSNFWDCNLEDIEAGFLASGTKVTDLPITLDPRVPQQGSVLMNNCVDIDDIMAPASMWRRIAACLGH